LSTTVHLETTAKCESTQNSIVFTNTTTSYTHNLMWKNCIVHELQLSKGWNILQEDFSPDFTLPQIGRVNIKAGIHLTFQPEQILKH